MIESLVLLLFPAVNSFSVVEVSCLTTACFFIFLYLVVLGIWIVQA